MMVRPWPFVEVRTGTVRDTLKASPELSVTTDKQPVLVRTARRFLGRGSLGIVGAGLDVLAIDKRLALAPVVRLLEGSRSWLGAAVS
jgi:hypothetical protein